MNYQKYVQECFNAQQKGIPVDELWHVFDARFRAKYLVGPLMTSKMLPDKRLPKHSSTPVFLPSPIALRRWRKRWGSTHRGLPPASPKERDYARSGDDLEFKRGAAALPTTDTMATLR